jgi:MraZ protein
LPFTGIHDHTLDAKNRLTIPARFRPDLAQGIVLTKGFEPCLQLYPKAEYEQLAESALVGVNPFSPQGRELRRHLYGNTLPGELDSAGRVMLPGPFAEYASVSKEVTVVGSGQYLEIWDKTAWREYDTGLIGRAADHIASVGHPG